MNLPTTFFGWVAFIAEKYGVAFLKGAGTSVYLAVLGTLLGCIIGFWAGTVRTVPLTKEDNLFKRVGMNIVWAIIRFYVWVFRGTPMMVQAMVIFYGAAAIFGVHFQPLMAGLLVVSINTGAYMCETVRGGIQSIDPGQIEGAKAIGMSHGRTMLSVVVPQAFRNITPQIGNYLVSNIKDTSVLSVITVNELFYAARSAAGVYFRYFEVFFVVSCIYRVLTTLANALLHLVERRMNGPRDYELADPASIPELKAIAAESDREKAEMQKEAVR